VTVRRGENQLSPGICDLKSIDPEPERSVRVSPTRLLGLAAWPKEAVLLKISVDRWSAFCQLQHMTNRVWPKRCVTCHAARNCHRGLLFPLRHQEPRVLSALCSRPAVGDIKVVPDACASACSGRTVQRVDVLHQFPGDWMVLNTLRPIAYNDHQQVS
jgi:hypothetical protein